MAVMNINIQGNPIVACGANVPAGGNVGIYEIILNVGTDIGWTGITCDALGIPDRFQIYYNNALVIDSKYIGNQITNMNPTGGITLGNYTLNNFEYNGTDFVPTGTTSNITIGTSDIANNTTEASYGINTFLFNKTTANPTTLRVVATGSPGSGTTSWGLTGICPVPTEDLISGTEKFVYIMFTEVNKGNNTRSAKFVLNDAGTRFYTNRLGATNFNSFGYSVSTSYLNDGINWWQIDINGNVLTTGTL